VNLTDEQQEKIKPLFQNEAQQVEAVRSDKTLSRRERAAKVREIRAATQEQVKSYLTPEQLQKLSQFREERGERREQNQDRAGQNGTWRMHGRQTQPMTWQERFEQFSKTLNLTFDQKQKIQPLFEDEDEQITAVYDDTTTAPTEKPARVKAIRSATEDKIEPFLTPDQMEKWGEWKQRNWDRAQESREASQERRETSENQTEWQKHQRSGNWKQKFERLNKTVNLTDEQQEKIKPLFQDEDRQIKALKKDKSLSKQARQAATQDIQKATWTQIQSILTPEQLEKLGVKPEPAQVSSEDQKSQSGDPAQGQQSGNPSQGQQSGDPSQDQKDKDDDK
jgi:Spy/CpxP family protein refolding chaperone